MQNIFLETPPGKEIYWELTVDVKGNIQSHKKEKRRTHNVTLRRSGEIIASVEKQQVLHISVCIFLRQCILSIVYEI